MDKQVELTVPDHKLFEDKYCHWDNETRSAILDISKNTKMKTFACDKNLFICKKQKKIFCIDKKHLLANFRLLDYFIPVKYLFLRNYKTKEVETPVQCAKKADGKQCEFSSRHFKTVKTAALDIVV